MCLCRYQDMTREQFQGYLFKQAWPFLYEKCNCYAGQTLTINIPINEGLRNSRGVIEEYDGVALVV